MMIYATRKKTTSIIIHWYHITRSQLVFQSWWLENDLRALPFGLIIAYNWNLPKIQDSKKSSNNPG